MQCPLAIASTERHSLRGRTARFGGFFITQNRICVIYLNLSQHNKRVL